jgi:hypothetical protein
VSGLSWRAGVDPGTSSRAAGTRYQRIEAPAPTLESGNGARGGLECRGLGVSGSAGSRSVAAGGGAWADCAPDGDGGSAEGVAKAGGRRQALALIWESEETLKA